MKNVSRSPARSTRSRSARLFNLAFFYRLITWGALLGNVFYNNLVYADEVGKSILVLNTNASKIYTDIMGRPIDNGIYLSGGGALVSFCPLLACLLRPTSDHQRTAALFASTTQDDSHSEEQTVAIETIVKTGFQKQWSPNTHYQTGDNVVRSAQNSIYRAISSGVSAAGGEGPKGKRDDIGDGSVHWRWINDAAIGSKVGLYNELVALPGAGAVWGQANNVSLSHGVLPTFASNTEFDFGNNAGPCMLGKQQCYNLFLETSGLSTTASIYVTTTNTQNAASYFGVLLAGEKLASSVDLEDDASAAIGIGICADKIRKCLHSDGDIVDAAEGPSAIKVMGSHTIATIYDTSDSPTFASISGKKTRASLYDRSVAPVGLDLEGDYLVAQIKGSGWLVTPGGLVFGQAFMSPVSQPPSSHDACNAGEFKNSKDYYYVCVSQNHWKRAPLLDF